MLEDFQGDSWGSIPPLRMSSLLPHDLCHGRSASHRPPTMKSWHTWSWKLWLLKGDFPEAPHNTFSEKWLYIRTPTSGEPLFSSILTTLHLRRPWCWRPHLLVSPSLRSLVCTDCSTFKALPVEYLFCFVVYFFFSFQLYKSNSLKFGKFCEQEIRRRKLEFLSWNNKTDGKLSCKS